MADVWSKAKRSQVMGLVRSSGNKETELRMIAIMRANKVTGWRRNQKLLGKPDFVFRKQRVIVFVDGCFWHGCPKCYRRPLSNQEYWDAKVARNKARDKTVTRELRAKGWEVIRVWDHQLAEPASVAKRLSKAMMRAGGHLHENKPKPANGMPKKAGDDAGSFYSLPALSQPAYTHTQDANQHRQTHPTHGLD